MATAPYVAREVSSSRHTPNCGVRWMVGCPQNTEKLKAISIAALLVARAQSLTLRHAQQENNEVRDDRELSHGS